MTPTIWVQNTDKDTPSIGYSSSTVTYNSSTTYYSGIDVTLPEFDETPTTWTGETKTPTDWNSSNDSSPTLWA